MKRASLILLSLWLGTTAVAAQPRGSLLPSDWIEQPRDSTSAPLRYTSPDGEAWLTLHATPAQGRRAVEPSRPDEEVTYRRSTARFVAVSGYKGDRIFYRKSNLACGGTRWHHISLEYPARDKRKMDRIVTRLAHGMNRYDRNCRSRPGTSGGLVSGR